VVPRLILSVDQVAAIRASRQSLEPDPVHFALDAEMAGFEGIKAHLRLDRRHIIENDVELLNKMVKSDFFLQISTNQDVLHLVNSLRPRNLILVSERRDEVHTDTGLDVSLLGKQLYHTIREIDDRETKVFLAVDPDLEQIRASAKLEVHGLCISLRDQILQDTQFTRSSSGFFRTAEAVKLSVKYGLETHLFNSISWNVLPRLTSIPGVSAIHLGHHFISDCLFRGLHETARAYRQRLNEFHEEK
jgi:pyridoxine 5-phosphate synthase